MRFVPPLVAALLVVLVAGCGGPSDERSPPMLPSESAATSPIPPPEYAATIVVTKETPGGDPLQAEVQAVPLRPDGTLGEVQVRGTDAQGAARFRFGGPTTVLVRVDGPDGWTSEGARVHVGTAVAAEGLTVSDHDVFVPLYRDTLEFVAGQAWSTAAAQPRADGVAPAVVTQDLAFPEGLQAAYLSRLTDARVLARWTDTQDGRALNASVGLAWGGAVWVEGPGAPLSPGGQRQALWDGELPAEGRPQDAATPLQTALLTRTAIVGEVLFGLETTLRFGGHVPAGMPADDCHGRLC